MQEHPTCQDTDKRDGAVRYERPVAEADVWADHAIVHLPGGKQAVIEGGANFDGGWPEEVIRRINNELARDYIDAVCWRYRWMGGVRTPGCPAGSAPVLDRR